MWSSYRLYDTVRLANPRKRRIYLSSNTWVPLVFNVAFHYIWAATWDFQQCGMCDQQSLRSACAYAQSDQSLCWSLEHSTSVKLLTEQNLGFLSLTGGCSGWSESTLVKMPHCWESRVVFVNLLLNRFCNGLLTFSTNVCDQTRIRTQKPTFAVHKSQIPPDCATNWIINNYVNNVNIFYVRGKGAYFTKNELARANMKRCISES